MAAWKDGAYLNDLSFIRDAIQARLQTIRLVEDV